jgi:glycosyltransferase involved in cell wall biosynthesis
MRVLVVLNSLDLGGSQINALDFAAGAAGRGIDSALVGWRHTLPGSGPSLLDVASQRGLTIEVLDRPPTTLAAARSLSSAAHRHSADIVHVYSAWEARTAFWGPAVFGRRPLVITVYEMFLPRETLPSATVVVGARYLAEDHADRLGRLHLISPPVDLDRDDPDAVDSSLFRDTLGLSPDQTLLVTVSRLAETMKAVPVHTAITAMAALPPAVVLAVVGDGEAAPRLRDLAAATNQRLGRQAVHMVGAMHDPRPAYAAADVVIGMGGSAARGLALGRPLIAVGERGWSRRFEPDTADLLFRDSFWSADPVDDPVADLVAALTPLLGDPARRKELGDFGRAFAERSFGLAAMTDRLVDVYREASASRATVSWWRDLPHELRVSSARQGQRLWRRRSG